VGRNPPGHVRSLGQVDGVTITGTVDDVRPYIGTACVYIVPLRIAGGSRLKILEAMAMGKAVVSTSIGAEGFDFVSGQNIMIADGPEDFANAVIRCMDNPELRHRISDNGQKLVHQNYRWELLGEKLDSYIRSIVVSCRSRQTN